jgi:hypothetical protein
MKRFFAFAAAFALVVIVGTTEVSAQRTKDDGVLRILAIGNSFSDDGMEYLPLLLDNMGIENVEVARLYVGGCSLERHMNFYDQKQAPYQFYYSATKRFNAPKTKTNIRLGNPEANLWQKTDGVSLLDALTWGEWDIITMQQVSGLSGIYDSYQPHLNRLVEVVRKYQPHAKIAWQMTWAYSTDSQHGDFPRYGRNQQQMLDAIYASVYAMLKEVDFDYIIPSGTAIQSLRLSEVNNHPLDLTRDGYHMDLGAGRYTLACVWYETLIKPYTHKSMKGNTLYTNLGNVHVTEHNAPYFHKAAKKATKKPFKPRKIKHNRK